MKQNTLHFIKCNATQNETDEHLCTKMIKIINFKCHLQSQKKTLITNYNWYFKAANFNHANLQLMQIINTSSVKNGCLIWTHNTMALIRHTEEVLPQHGLARFWTVPGVTASVSVVNCMAVSVAESPPTAPSMAAPSRLTYSPSLMSQEDARFTRHGLLFGWLEKLSTHIHINN